MIISACITACSHKRGGSEDTARTVVPEEEYHADNDIAMTVRSLADALRIGEPLDSVDYDFEGVLTDGQGRPLYTDMEGAPGVWQVDVTSPTSAVIRNVRLGDLLPIDLENYLLQSMGDNVTRVPVEENPVDDGARSVYNLDDVYITIETRTRAAETGQLGALMNIMASTTAPI